MDLSPILTVSRPFLGDIYHGQIQHFQGTVIGWKYRLGFGDDYSGVLWATCPDFESHHSGEWEPYIPVIQSHLIGLYCIYFPYTVNTDKRGRKLWMNKYREILCLKSLGFSVRNIAQNCDVSKSTVAKVLKKGSENQAFMAAGFRHNRQCTRWADVS